MSVFSKLFEQNEFIGASTLVKTAIFRCRTAVCDVGKMQIINLKKKFEKIKFPEAAAAVSSVTDQGNDNKTSWNIEIK